MNLNNKSDKRNRYTAPQVEQVELVPENFTLASSLEDYEDNPIFGAPAINSVDDINLFL